MPFCMRIAILRPTVFEHMLRAVVLNARVTETMGGEIFDLKDITSTARVESGGRGREERDNREFRIRISIIEKTKYS